MLHSAYPKIIIPILVAFIISFSSLLIFLNWNYENDELARWGDKFYSQNFDGDAIKIVILGSSQAARLNATYIEYKISSFDHEYEVYNLSIVGNKPQHRFSSLDRIISIKPDLVLYGVGFLEFEKPYHSQSDKPPSALFDPEEFLDMLFIGNSPIDFIPDLFNPKFATLKFIRSIGAETSDYSKLLFDPKMPYYHPKNSEFNKLATMEEITEQVGTVASWKGIKDYDRNIGVIYLKKIVKKFQDNNIQVIIVTVPHPKIYLDATPLSYHEFLDSFVENFGKESNVPVYRLHDKYDQNDIWYDYRHVALHPKVPIFNDDISNIILNEIDT